MESMSVVREAGEVGMTIETLIRNLQNDILRLGYNATEREIIEHIKCAITLLKEHEEEVTEYVIDEFQPTCKVCGFRPFAGFIPSLEWMRERGFNYCPHCKIKVKWK